MNDSEFEDQLRSLRPAAPSPGLQGVIARELSKPSMQPGAMAAIPANETESLTTRILHGLPWAVGGAAAAVLVMTLMERSDTNRVAGRITDKAPTEQKAQVAAAPREFRAEAPSREILHAVEGDIILAEQEEPSRLVRVNSLERRTWSNPYTGAQIAVELPREDLVLVPVAYQ